MGVKTKWIALAAGVCIALHAPFAALASAQVPVSWKTIRTDRDGLWKGRAVYPRFGGGGAVADLANKAAAKTAQDTLDEFRRAASGVRGKLQFLYEMESLAIVSVATPQLISLYFDTTEYTGGAHGNRFYQPMNFAIVNGKAQRLKLQDLFKKGVDARQVVSDAVLPKLRDLKASAVVDGDITELPADLAESFVITPSGLTFLFEPYAVASYAEGSFIIKIPFEELRGSLLVGGPADLPQRA